MGFCIDGIRTDERCFEVLQGLAVSSLCAERDAEPVLHAPEPYVLMVKEKAVRALSAGEHKRALQDRLRGERVTFAAEPGGEARFSDFRMKID